MDCEMIEEIAEAMAAVIAKRHGHLTEDWLNDQRREEAQAAYSVMAGRIEELERDRRRYQWLANAVLACDYGDNGCGGADFPDRIGWSVQLTRRNADPFIFGQSIDAAIDAALSPSTEEVARAALPSMLKGNSDE